MSRNHGPSSEQSCVCPHGECLQWSFALKTRAMSLQKPCSSVTAPQSWLNKLVLCLKLKLLHPGAAGIPGNQGSWLTAVLVFGDREEWCWLQSPEHVGHTLPSSHYNFAVVNEFSVLKTKVIFIPDRNFWVTYKVTLLLSSWVSSALKMSTVLSDRWGGPVLCVLLMPVWGWGGVGWGWGMGYPGWWLFSLCSLHTGIWVAAHSLGVQPQI